ncbi:uncharacterized protein LOC131314489 isoform X1 [Rhododendron vialii]|uniref:uncharacterized protein LOC131314489 isoform X1 n=1 Tax=Rhododendron vialii TaxID=182163 RepID=UPI00265E3A8F|nr:uncharacterized protein LOC131314489 isoform X1 [Rhododendron vialii]XP_058199132.1 uncharacterized protein LOC131314489 isoform X1 [Rhododendron vialii]XP_058199134.1 uncharacterized protein LOC131314489 isoform X1 [Rhododendron vialii]
MATSSNQPGENMAVNTSEPEKKEYSRYLPLYKAVLRGDWETAQRFFDQDPGALTAPINEFSETALFVAAVEGRNTNNFVKKLVDKMPPGSVDEAYGSVLKLATQVGNTEAVKGILSKNPSLLYYREDDKWTLFAQAASNGMRDTLLYLLELVKNEEDSSKLFPDEDSAAFLMAETICSGFYDIALYLVKKYPLLAVSKKYPLLAVSKQDTGVVVSGLDLLAIKASAFKSGTHYRWWQRIIYAHVPVKSVDCIISPTLQTVLVENPVDRADQVMGRSSYNWTRLFVEYFCISVPCIKHIQKQKEMHLQTLELLKCFCKGIASLPDSAKHRSLTHHAILSAAKNGIPEIVHEIVESFPSVLGTVDSTGRRVFEKAVLERQEHTFNLIYQMGKYSRQLALHKYDKGNHILHLAGKLAPPTKLSQISGAALQMQLELQWFEAVKQLMSPRDIDWKNKDQKTPAMIFTEEHKKLVAEGEKWMKDTANSCTIPAALIVTMVFAAAITVPGGINGTNGVPVFNKEVAFNIFAVSDAISLFTSTTSLLVFLSILTSRYAERDFLFALPNRLIIGLFTLFVSITAMLIAFSCAIYLLFGNRAWILYPVAGLACVPIISFASLQYPLLRDLMKSTYGPGIFGKQSEVPFYN